MADVFDGDFNGLEYLVVPEGWFESEHFVIRAIALILVSEEMLLSQAITEDETLVVVLLSTKDLLKKKYVYSFHIFPHIP